MKATSIAIYDFFTSQAAFTNVMGAGDSCRLYPVVAPEGVDGHFATYVINEKTGLSKDTKQVAVTLYLWYRIQEYSACVDFTDTVTELIENGGFEWVSSTIDFNAELGLYAGIINFNKL